MPTFTYTKNIKPGDIQKMVILTANEKQSQSGNDMIVLECEPEDANYQVNYPVKDYLVFSDRTAWKLSEFADAVGIPRRGDQVSIETEDCMNKSAWALIGEKKYTNRNGEEKTSLTIERWLTPDQAKRQLGQTSASEDQSDFNRKFKEETFEPKKGDELPEDESIPF